MQTIVAKTNFKHQALNAIEGVPYTVDEAAAAYFIKLGWAEEGSGPGHVVEGLTVNPNTGYGDTGKKVMDD